MKSVFAISLDTANAIYGIASVLLIAGAVATLIGTLGVIWSGGVRERHADERIAANEAETAKAQERAARANAEAERARLEQQRLKAEMAWRRVSPEQAHGLVTILAGKLEEVWLTFVGDDPESVVFRGDLNTALESAGVRTKYFSGYAMAVGLTVCGGSKQQRDLLIGAFRGVGLPLVENCQKKGMAKGELEITVGSKPPPTF